MAQTQSPVTNLLSPIADIVDQWFDAVDAVLSVQRSWITAALDSPLPPLYPLIPAVAQTDDEHIPTSV